VNSRRLSSVRASNPDAAPATCPVTAWSTNQRRHPSSPSRPWPAGTPVGSWYNGNLREAATVPAAAAKQRHVATCAPSSRSQASCQIARRRPCHYHTDGKGSRATEIRQHQPLALAPQRTLSRRQCSANPSSGRVSHVLAFSRLPRESPAMRGEEPLRSGGIHEQSAAGQGTTAPAKASLPPAAICFRPPRSTFSGPRRVSTPVHRASFIQQASEGRTRAL